MMNKSKLEKRVFSVELKSKRSLKNVSIADGTGDRVLVEGTIGELVQAKFAEGMILEVVGKERLGEALAGAD